MCLVKLEIVLDTKVLECLVVACMIPNETLRALKLRSLELDSTTQKKKNLKPSILSKINFTDNFTIELNIY